MPTAASGELMCRHRVSGRNIGVDRRYGHDRMDRRDMSGRVGIDPDITPPLDFAATRCESGIGAGSCGCGVRDRKMTYCLAAPILPFLCHLVSPCLKRKIKKKAVKKVSGKIIL